MNVVQKCTRCGGLFPSKIPHHCDRRKDVPKGPILPVTAPAVPIEPPLHHEPHPVGTAPRGWDEVLPPPVDVPPILIYLAGPMTGFPNFNAETFAKYAEKYRDQGFEVISPPELDDGDYSHEYSYYIRRDMKVLLERGVERIYLIPGWHKSRGACLEKHIADILAIPLYDAETGEPWQETVLQEAYRLVHGDRGEDYGHPFDDFAKTVGAINALFGVGPSGLFNRPMVQEEWAMAMVIAKVSRQINLGKRENPVDMAGYAETLQMVVDERARRMRDGL